MEFESQDVAKEFPGLAQALDDSPENEDGGKSKRKKSKDSTSKKDKEKGYAALDGESSPEEEHDELPGTSTNVKSPGKVKKIKSFKLTSSKKKEKKPTEKEKEPKKSNNEKEIKKTEKEKPIEKIKVKEPVASSSNTPAVVTTVTPRRPFDGRSIRPPAPLASLLSQTPSLSKSKDKDKVKEKDKDKIKEKDKDKESAAKDIKRERKESGSGAGALRVKLRLRRGSKSSIEEPEPHHHGHAPDAPEVIVKEIHKYETLLEQTHAQCNKGKKISKKQEELLWELQRNLTQLKRKLRSINALSTISTDRELQAHSSKPKDKDADPVVVLKETITAVLDPEPQIPNPIINPIPLHIPEFELDLTPRIFVPLPIQEIPEPKPAPTVLIVEEQTPIEQDIQRRASNTSTSEVILPISLPKPPSRTPSPNLNLELDTQSQKSEISEDDENDNESEVVHAEIHRIPSSECPTDSEDEDIDLEPVLVGEDAEVLLPSPSADHDDRLSIGGDVGVFCEDDQSPYPELRMAPSNVSSITDGICPSPSALQGFDPFSLSLFKTDEFLEFENDALLKFNGELQDEIVHEEEEIQKIITKLNDTPRREDSSIKELEEIEDDELFSIWQTARAENDLLHERIMHLKAMVVAYKIDIFKLEVRQRYLEQLRKSSEEPIISNRLCNGNGNGLQILTHH